MLSSPARKAAFPVYARPPCNPRRRHNVITIFIRSFRGVAESLAIFAPSVRGDTCHATGGYRFREFFSKINPISPRVDTTRQDTRVFWSTTVFRSSQRRTSPVCASLFSLQSKITVRPHNGVITFSHFYAAPRVPRSNVWLCNAGIPLKKLPGRSLAKFTAQL